MQEITTQDRKATVVDRVKQHKNGILTGASVGVGMLLVPTGAMAAGTPTSEVYDLSPATDSISNQIQSALTTVLPYAGGLLAIGIVWKLYKRFTKA